jgi:cytosine/adenosine deaminase-related metal-dependent hydrolase
MHEAMRAVANLHRTTEPNRKDWVRAEDVLRMAILGGAAALQSAEQLGVISPGYFADLVFYNLDHPSWVPINDIVGQLVFAETGASVAMVMVGGRLVFANGKPTTFDADAVIRGVREMARHLRVRNADLFEVADQMVELVP